MADEDRQEFVLRMGEKIAGFRRAKGMTQEQLAEMVGGNCTNKKVSSWETAAHEISAFDLYRVTNVLGISPDMLMDVKPEAAAYNPEYGMLSAESKKSVDAVIRRFAEVEMAG